MPETAAPDPFRPARTGSASDAPGAGRVFGRWGTPACILLLLAAIGILAAQGPRFEGFGAVRPAAPQGAPADRPADLSGRLGRLAEDAGITPAQMPAWNAFAADMRELSALTLAFEARLSAGAAVDAPRERALHALLLGSALARIDGALTPRQAEQVRRAMGGLVPNLICRALASS